MYLLSTTDNKTREAQSVSSSNTCKQAQDTWNHSWNPRMDAQVKNIMQRSAVQFAANTSITSNWRITPSHQATEHTITTLWKTSRLQHHSSNCRLCISDLHNPSDPAHTDGTGCLSAAGAWAPWEWGSYFAAWHKGHLFTLLCSLALPCEHSQASQRKEPLCDTHLTLKSSAASLALSISSMSRAFSSVFFLTWAGNMEES